MQMIKIVKMISSFLGLLNIVGKMIEKEDKDGDYDLSDKFIPFLYSQKSKFCKGSKLDIILHFPLPYLNIHFILFKDSYHYKLITSSPEIFHFFFIQQSSFIPFKNFFLRIIVSTSTKWNLFTVTFFLLLSVKICQFTHLTATLFHRCTCSDRLFPRRASYKGIEDYLLVEGSA